MVHHCNKCKLGIDTEKERYVIVEDIENKKTLSKLWFHKECWHEIMTNKGVLNKLTQQAQSFMEMAKQKAGIEDEENYEVKS